MYTHTRMGMYILCERSTFIRTDDDACLWIWIEPNNNNNKKGLHVSFFPSSNIIHECVCVCVCLYVFTEHMDTNYVEESDYMNGYNEA